MKFLSGEKNQRQAASGCVLFSFYCIDKLSHDLVAESNDLFLLFWAVVEHYGFIWGPPCSHSQQEAGPGLVLPHGLCLAPGGWGSGRRPSPRGR